MAGNIAGSTAKGFSTGKRKAEDGVRESGSDTDTDTESEIQLAENLAASMSQLEQQVDIFGKEFRAYVALVNEMGTTMKSIGEVRKVCETLKEKRIKWMNDNAAVLARMDQRHARLEEEERLAQREGACHEGSEVMKMALSSIN